MARTNNSIRYAVVGLGHIAQVAVLPAFAHAKRNSQLVALVSDDQAKLKVLSRKYRNSLHAEYCIRAAKAGVHVLCEKPMAVTVAECRQMIRACRSADVKLMIAYRLHFEEVNLKAIEMVRRGRIGEPKFFNSSFALTVRPGPEAIRDRRIDWSAPSFRGRTRGGLCHELQRCRCGVVPNCGHQGAVARGPCLRVRLDGVEQQAQQHGQRSHRNFPERCTQHSERMPL